ncbi:hypothetical protein RvY_16969-2 [Ramazzottius varieornatus]|uniref:Uncharacterized protein n=1 Tax=Ramazzottius varieornatus TaxID=947166 RepID=A0A1D1W0G5_RAMVA|nr:hypothetical protein RvY_16969-2 [Ramazzottius varieornatus]
MPNGDIAAQSPVISHSPSLKKTSLLNPNLIFSTVTPPALTRGSFVQRASLDLKRTSLRPKPADVGLQSFDFIPHCIEPEKTLKLGRWPEFEDFTSLVPPANDFLRRNPHLTIKTCETVQLNVEEEYLKTPEQTDYMQYAESVRPFVRAMRMWVTTIDDQRAQEPQQIAYVNFLPPHPQIEGVSKTDYAYQNATELAAVVNEYLDANPLHGRLLNVESLQIRDQDDPFCVDMNLTAWDPQPVRSVPRQRFVNCFRIWYVMGHPARQTIGIVDVFPATRTGEAHIRVEREKDKKYSMSIEKRRSKRRKISVIEHQLQKEKKEKAKQHVVKDKPSRFPKVESFDIIMAKLNAKGAATKLQSFERQPAVDARCVCRRRPFSRRLQSDLP